MTVNYLPLEEREPDTQYRELLALIVEAGIPAQSMHTMDSISYLSPKPLRFDLKNGVPLITERSLKGSWRSAVAELFAFLHGIHTQEELVAFGVNPVFWRDFVSEEQCARFGLEPGDLGDGSYGKGFAGRKDQQGNRVNQIERVIAQIRKYPQSRTHFIDPWIPEFCVPEPGQTRKVVVAPCHGWMLFRVLEGKLYLSMTQRSADMPIGVPHNMIQYAALLIAVAYVLDLEAGWYYHGFLDSHIYNNQLNVVNEILSREPRPFPRLDLAEGTPKDILAIRPEHFILSEYEPHDAIKGIPVAV